MPGTPKSPRGIDAVLGPEGLLELLEQGTEGVWMYEPETDRVSWSPRLRASLGFERPPEHLADIEGIVHPDDRARHATADEELLARGSGHYRMRIRLLRRDGTAWPVRVHGVLHHARCGGTCLMGFVLDDQETADARANLDRSEARFRAFMDQCPAAVFIKRGRTHVYVNERAADISGRRVEDFVGKSAHDVFPPDMATAFEEADARVLREGRPVTMAGSIDTPEGTKRYIHDVKFPVPDIESEGFLVGGFGVDITEHVERERQLRRLDERMQAKQRLEAVGSLARGVAHDFNNLLLTIVAHAELAESATLPAQRARHLDKIVDRARYAGQLCHRLLSFSGERSGSHSPLDLGALVERSGELEDSARHCGARLETRVCSDLPRVRGDAVQLRQVLLNLVMNAAQAVPREAAPIQLEVGAQQRPTERQVFHSWLTTTGPVVGVTVTDEGEGMDAAQLSQVFDPFFTTKMDGHGLGMSTVLGIVRSHGGAVGIDSRPGDGTRVDVWLPAESFDEPPAQGN